jgi:hypothetical protein
MIPFTRQKRENMNEVRRVRIKTWEEMRKEGKINSVEGIEIGSDVFTTHMEDLMPKDRAIKVEQISPYRFMWTVFDPDEEDGIPYSYNITPEMIASEIESEDAVVLGVLEGIL